MKRRIAVISIAEYPGTALPEFVNLVQGLQRKSFQTIVVAGSTEPFSREVDPSGNIILRLPVRSRLEKEFYFFRAGWLLRKEKIDVVHLFWRFGAWLFILTRLLSREKIIMDVRSGSIARTAWRRFIENSILYFEKFFFQTRLTIDPGLNIQLGLRATGFLPLGISPSYLAAATHAQKDLMLRATLGISSKTVIGIFVGTSFGRRLEILLQAWSIFSATKSGDSHHLVIIGDGYYDAQLRQQGQSLACSFIPPIPQDHLIPYLAEASYGISFVPITPWFTWQQSTKILDYSAFQLPIVATATQSNQQFVKDGMNGILTVDTQAAVVSGLVRLAQLLPQARFQSSNKILSKQLVTTYTWDYLIQKHLIPLYEQLA